MVPARVSESCWLSCVDCATRLPTQLLTLVQQSSHVSVMQHTLEHICRTESIIVSETFSVVCYASSAYLLVGPVEGVGVVCLSTHHPGHLVDETHVHAHLEALVESINVA